MKLAVLFSGGKDSTLALYRAISTDDVKCLITIKSKNKESYMFHTPNIDIASEQARSLDIPIIEVESIGEKEKELTDLKNAVLAAKEKYDILGVVTGAVGSVYQAERVQKICSDLDLFCFNPLWQIDQVELLREIVSLGFEVVISGVYAYPFDKTWVGRKIDAKMIDELIELNKKYKINPAGEGGEIETTVLNGPNFKKKIEIVESEIVGENNSFTLIIKKTKMVENESYRVHEQEKTCEL